MNDNVGQQRLYATEQRVASAREQLSVATRVAAVQEGPDEAINKRLLRAVRKKRVLRATRRECSLRAAR